MGVGKDKEFRLEARDFFQAYFRPVFRSIQDGNAAGVLNRIGDKGLLADGNERLGPDDEEGGAPGKGSYAFLNASESVLEVLGECFSGIWGAQDFRQMLRRGEDACDGLRIDGVGGNAEVGEGKDRVEAIQTFRCEHQIRVQIGDGFQAGANDAADLGFVLGVRGKVAIVGVADEEILQAEGVNGFGDAWRERNDAVQSLRDADGTADLVGDFA